MASHRLWTLWGVHIACFFFVGGGYPKFEPRTSHLLSVSYLWAILTPNFTFWDVAWICSNCILWPWLMLLNIVSGSFFFSHRAKGFPSSVNLALVKSSLQSPLNTGQFQVFSTRNLTVANCGCILFSYQIPLFTFLIQSFLCFPLLYQALSNVSAD